MYLFKNFRVINLRDLNKNILLFSIFIHINYAFVTEMKCYSCKSPIINATFVGQPFSSKVEIFQFGMALTLLGVKPEDRIDCHEPSKNHPTVPCPSKVCMKTVVHDEQANLLVARYCVPEKWFEHKNNSIGVTQNCDGYYDNFSCSCRSDLCNNSITVALSLLLICSMFMLTLIC